jgi:hypothetical protein
LDTYLLILFLFKSASMKKFNLLKFSFALTLIAGPIAASAQSDMYHGDVDNYYSQYVGPGRVLVISPSTVAKPLNYTIAEDWGNPMVIPSDGSLLNKELVKADPYDVCAALTNPSALNGKIALVMRGNCEFGAKALAVQNAGAKACIIVNHSPGGPVGMGAGAQGAGVTIPVIMISKEDGADLEAALTSGTVIMSLSKWGNGLTHDIGFVDRGLSLWHEYAIPYSQVKDAASLAKNAYKGINGAVIANFGSSNQTDVKIKATVSWTPTGGSATVIRTDSIVRTSFGVGDSIITPFVNETYQLASMTGPGRYDVSYDLSMANNADEFINDNKASYSFHVTPNVLSKGRYDFTKGEGISNTYNGFATPTNFLMGNLHYISKGDYLFQNVQLTISNGSATDSNLKDHPPVNVWFFKWSDASSDNVIQPGELTMEGVGVKEFKDGDTNRQIFTVKVDHPTDQTKKVVTQADSWYWIAADMPSGSFLGCDGQLNMQPRTYFRDKATSSFNERYTAVINASQSDYFQSTADALMYPFENGPEADSARFSQQRGGFIPSLPVYLSVFPVSVKEQTGVTNLATLSVYPNPASTTVNVSVELEKISEKVYYSIVDGMGKSVKKAMRNNIKNDTYSFSTSDLAAGIYYFAVNANGKVSVQKFTIVK